LMHGSKNFKDLWFYFFRRWVFVLFLKFFEKKLFYKKFLKN
jgi:hypothetical protein